MIAPREWHRELETERAMKNEFMIRDPESPFVVGRVPFHELRYFPPDPKFVIRATLKRRPTPEEVYLRTNRDNQAVMRYIGDLEFSIGRQPLHLCLYHAGEGVGTSVFVPFRDLTSGDESYGPGRYLTLELNEADVYEVDFNRAFNPYCAYTDDFECAFPPSENDLAVEIPVGEKAWAADRNPRSPSGAVLGRVRASSPKASRPAPRRPAKSPKPKGGRTLRKSR
ncbi:MAG: DUF1684 domain-containing protein [Thermoplasmata archaeon]|nr:DUF1684 domain-containing protein [Thermoplasmata archaeon]